MKNKDLFFRINIFVSIFIIILVNCNHNENDSIINNDNINLILVDGSQISTNNYNELNPIIIKQVNDIYLYYSTDNKELKNYKGGYDIYMCKWNSSLNSFNFPEILYITCPKKMMK